MPTTRDVTGALCLGGVRLSDLVAASEIQTPSYVYDVDAMANDARELKSAFDGRAHLVAYAVKANTAGPVVRAFAEVGCGADVVSGGEMLVALGCGIAPDAIVFSGVAKGDEEIDRAILVGDRGIGAIQIESIEEIARVDARAKAAGRIARVSLRMNPGVDIEDLDTHANIATGHDEAKFGVPNVDTAFALEALRGSPHVALQGVGAHVGSQFTSVDPYVQGARTVFEMARSVIAAGFALKFVDAGGGFGIDYGKGCPVRPADFVRAARDEQVKAGLGDLALYVEPGRALVGAHGVLLARVIQTKTTRALATPRRWVMIDAGMNDLLRPALYQAHHRIVPLAATTTGRADEIAFRVVGPVCESSDDFGEHVLPAAIAAGDAVALVDAGAYGFTMASRYNGRALPAEVFLRGGRVAQIRPRKPVADWVDDRVF